MKNWIRINDTLPDSEKVFRVAAALEVPAPQALGLMVRWLTWVDAHCTEASTGMRPADVDAVCYGTQGCCEALAAIGWVQVVSGHVVICEFDKYLSPTSKVRVLATMRAQKCRARKGGKQ